VAAFILYLHYIRQVNRVKLADILFSRMSVCVSVRPSVRTQYLDASISKTVTDRGLVPITH